MVSSHARSPWLCSAVGLSGIDMRFIMTSSMRLSHFARSPLQWNGARSLTCPCSGCVTRCAELVELPNVAVDSALGMARGARDTAARIDLEERQPGVRARLGAQQDLVHDLGSILEHQLGRLAVLDDVLAVAVEGDRDRFAGLAERLGLLSPSSPRPGERRPTRPLEASASCS